MASARTMVKKSSSILSGTVPNSADSGPYKTIAWITKEILTAKSKNVFGWTTSALFQNGCVVRIEKTIISSKKTKR